MLNSEQTQCKWLKQKRLNYTNVLKKETPAKLGKPIEPYNLNYMNEII
jgi:hypothetical protein